MAAGALDPTKAFMTGKLKIKGDMTMGRSQTVFHWSKILFQAMRLQHIFKQLSEDLKAKEAAPAADSDASSGGSYGYGDLDKVISKIGKALEKNKGKQKGIAVLDFGEPAVQMDLTVSLKPSYITVVKWARFHHGPRLYTASCEFYKSNDNLEDTPYFSCDQDTEMPRDNLSEKNFDDSRS